jgi:unsaturated chondroitin disaccharide hydrolase
MLTQTQIDNTLEQAFAVIRRTLPAMGTDRPQKGKPDLTYQRCGGSDWVDGYWSGQLWLAYHKTQNPIFFQAARTQRAYFAERLMRPESFEHDVGLLYSLSCAADYRLTGDGDARAMGLQAADILARRFNPVGRYIQAWDDRPETNGRLRGKFIVDCLENLPLLFWASQQTGDQRYAEIATAHTTTAIQYLIRADGSTYHTFDLNPDTGAPIGGQTHQGYSDESCWSRGQAWALHGFAINYPYLRDDTVLASACHVADYVVEHLPADFVPYWDYQLPAEAPQYRDSSAAAISASGLLALTDDLAHVPEKAARYRETAHHILNSLIADYTTFDHPTAEGLLLHGAGYVRGGDYEMMLPYGDYFFIEALLRASNFPIVIW